MKILITCPGKFGDLIYTLPAVIKLKEYYNCSVTFQTSPYCLILKSLLEQQPYLDNVLIDSSYKVQNLLQGCQPWQMSEPKDYDKIFHLGFRLYLDNSNKQIIEMFFALLKNEYNLDLNYDNNQYIFLKKQQKQYIAVNFSGETLLGLMSKQEFTEMLIVWKSILSAIKEEIIIISGKNDIQFYNNFFPNYKIICPNTLLETAILINNSKCFLGNQSCCAAIADGLKIPRVIYIYFDNAIPSGSNCEIIKSNDRVIKVSAKLKKFIKLKEAVFENNKLYFL
jgi:ADP-heptose:LPS heptosyltransferase